MSAPLAADANIYDVVIMTQSCDLVEYTDDDMVIVCPRFNLSDAKTKQGKNLNNKDGWNMLRKGRYAGLHLINLCEIGNHEFPYQIVDLQKIFGVPYWLAKQVAQSQGNRVRLLPPYREHLGQAFARQFMRVGLPIDLPVEYPYTAK